MYWDDFRKAVSEAKMTMDQADSAAGEMASILRGRLRKVPAWHLAALKKELRNFNAHTGKWNDAD